MVALRITHAICGTAMILTAVILRLEGVGGRSLVGLAVLGFFVLMSSYFDRSDRDAAS